MTGHVVFVGLALVLCTAVPSANTTANADSNPEIIVGAENVIVVKNMASTHPSSASEPSTRKSSPYLTLTSAELPVPTTTATTQSVDESSSVETIQISMSSAIETTTEATTGLPSIEPTTPVITFSVESTERPALTTVSEVPSSTASEASTSSTTTDAKPTTTTDASPTTTRDASPTTTTDASPTTTTDASPTTTTDASPTTTAEAKSTTSTMTSPSLPDSWRSASPLRTTVTEDSSPAPTTSVSETAPSSPTTVSSTTSTTTTVPSASGVPPTSAAVSTESEIPAIDVETNGNTVRSAFTSTVSSRSESIPLTTTTPMPASVVTGFRRTINRMGSSTALPSTVAQLLQLHKTQELLRQAAVVARIRQRYTAAMRVFYQNGNSEADLPECSALQVCNKVDVYSTPWVERQCRCPARTTCSKSVDPADGHTVPDKSRLYKTCEPVKELPECRFFRDATWTIEQTASNHTRQTLHCTCPKNAVAYLAKYELVPNTSGVNFKYSFACSPQVRQKCQPAEPCRLFTVKKRRVVDEVNSDTLCDCPAQQWCPSHHTDSSISPGSFFKEDHLKIFTGFCQPVV